MYQEFASVYDEFMGEVSYSEWADYIEALWKKHGCRPELVLDLACGTGSLTLELARRGYDMIGADISEDMLEIAREKSGEDASRVLFLQQDMREFELYGTVGSIVCTCDSLNYVTEKDEVLQVFRLADNYLDPGGLFIFDINTEYKFKTVLADACRAETYEDAAYIWENYYYEEEKINEYQVTFFREDPETGLYERSEETHYEKAYSVEEIKELLEQAGLKCEGAYDAFTMDAPKADSERICFVAREQTKKIEGR